MVKRSHVLECHEITEAMENLGLTFLRSVAAAMLAQLHGPNASVISVLLCAGCEGPPQAYHWRISEGCTWHLEVQCADGEFGGSLGDSKCNIPIHVCGHSTDLWSVAVAG